MVPALGISEKAARTGTSSNISLDERALLSGLVGFIRPLLTSLVSSVNDSVPPQEIIDNAAEHVCNGAEGRELISAMGSFFGAFIAHATTPASRPPNSTSSVDKGPESKAVTIPTQTIPKPISSHTIPPVVLELVYEHVFNNMPIRLLAFDETGTQIRMLERSAIADIILSRVPPDTPADLMKGQARGLVESLARYAILSHTWFRGTPGDVIFQGWSTREQNPRGNSKIVEFCKVAARDYGVIFGWMDTVCINKESSTELDESIRSMYNWYKLAHVCVTILFDTTGIENMHQDAWFTRGWTLQELLAPRVIRFYNRDWKPLEPQCNGLPPIDDPEFLGRYQAISDHLEHKGDSDSIPVQLEYQIYKATTITRGELVVFRLNPEHVPESRVFQLAAARRVTREEDKAYSLMGLLGVGITVAYGEGERSAFKRLVREIMVTKNTFADLFNHGRLADVIPSGITDYKTRSPVFDKIMGSTLHGKFPVEPITMTHLGVRIPLLLVPGFMKDRYQDSIPPTSETEKVTYTRYMYGNEVDYLLLDQTNSTAEWIEELTIDYDQSEEPVFHADPKVIFFGVINFWRNSGKTYSTGSDWLCIPFRSQERETFKVTEIDPSDLVQEGGPVVIRRRKNARHTIIKLTEEELACLGIQMATLFAI